MYISYYPFFVYRCKSVFFFFAVELSAVVSLNAVDVDFFFHERVLLCSQLNRGVVMSENKRACVAVDGVYSFETCVLLLRPSTLYMAR